MTADTRRTVTLASVIAGLSLVAASLGGGINWLVEMDRRVGGATTVADSLFYNDSVTASRLDRLEKAMGIRARKRSAAKPESAGLVRRVFRLLF